MATIRTTGASLTNSVDLNANNISVFDNTAGKYININDKYINTSEVIKATKNEQQKYEYPSDEITDTNISGLLSMINYIKTHSQNKAVNYYYEDNTNIIIKKKINNSTKSLIFDDNLTLNKINKTIKKFINNQIFEDNSSVLIKKQINRSKKIFNYDDNTSINTTNKITKNNYYKHFSISNLQENFMTNKTIINNNITRKIIPNFIQEDVYFYFQNTGGNATVDLTNYYTKSAVDNMIASLTADLSNYYTKDQVDSQIAASKNGAGTIPTY